jgi:putative DNA primase/helicase
MSIDADELKRTALNRWDDIYSRLGVEVGTGEHRPCPHCGGDDRFRYDNRTGNGDYYCSQCGPDTGLMLVQKVKGWTFPETLKAIAEIVGQCDEKVNNCEIDYDKRRASLNKLWLASSAITPGDPAGEYLASRGLSAEGVHDVKFCSACWESETERRLPAMAALVRNKEGQAVTIHRTYLERRTDGKIAKAALKSPRKQMPGVGGVNGCAIRLSSHSEAIGVAEGIETALTCTQVYEIPTWSVLNAGGMESFKPPDGVECVFIFMDRDGSFTGQKAAFNLAFRLKREGYHVTPMMPDIVGDYNDMLMRGMFKTKGEGR